MHEIMRHRKVWITTAILFYSLFVSATPSWAGSLEFRFIGNMAFQVTDGTFTILTDYPYVSGAFGYMEYQSDTVKPVGTVLCLITHEHDDHWNPASFRQAPGWFLTGPAGVTGSVNPNRVMNVDEAGQFGPATIRVYQTPHSGLVHYSYVLIWQGVRMFFAGDTNSSKELLAERDLDVAFVSPWLLNQLRASGQLVDAKMVVVYHHGSDEQITVYQDCVVPAQGQTFTVDR